MLTTKVVTTTNQILLDPFHYLNSIDSHVIQEGRVQQVSRMGKDAQFFGHSHRRVIGIYTIDGYDHPSLQLALVGIQAQVHGKLVGAQVGAVANHNAGIDLRMVCQPGIQAGVETGAD